MEKTNHDFYIGENKYHIYTPGKQISHLHTEKTNITFTYQENKYHIYTPGKQIPHLHRENKS